MIKNCDSKNPALESTVTTLKANLKKIKPTLAPVSKK